jgi:site-specific recombinase XerD
LNSGEVEKCLLELNDTQHRAIFSLIVEMGLTPSEILGDESLGIKGMYIQDLDTRNMTIKVQYRFKKDDRITTRLAPMTAPVLVAMRDYVASKNQTFNDFGKLFDLSDRMVRHFLSNLEEKTGIKKPIDTTTLRRTAIVKMLRGGLKPDEIKKRLGFVRPQEESILIVSSYFLPDLGDYERVFKDFLFDNMDTMASGVRASKN